jgi:uncharacterized protein
MEHSSQPRKKIITFLLLTFLFSSIFYYLILTSGSMHTSGGIYVLGLMWCPGLAAILVQLVYHRNLRDLGWKWGKTRYQFLSYIIPFLYAFIAYSIVWVTGLGGFPNQEFISQIVSQFNPGTNSPYLITAVYLLVASTFGILPSSLSALGEEIGWRGLLVPELAKVTTFTKTSLLSGLVWAVWHSPILIFGDYNSGTPFWYGLTCFTLMVLGTSTIMAWLRLRSGSLWTGVILHASHNLFIQNIFTPLTTDTGFTAYIIDEFGVALVIPILIIAYGFWKKRDQLLVTGTEQELVFAPAAN